MIADFAGFGSLIGQDDAKRIALRSFERARRDGAEPPVMLVSGRDGAGKSAFIQAAAVEWGWSARYMRARDLRKVDAFGEFVYSSVDRGGKFQGSLMPDYICPRILEGDRCLVIDDL